MSGGIACGHMAEERKAWRKNHPHGFVAKPETLPDETVKQGTDWEGGFFPITLHFCEYYPSKPPKCKFPRGFFHPNVYPSGLYAFRFSMTVNGGPIITVEQILVGIQDLLDQTEGYRILVQDNVEYKKQICLQEKEKQYPPLF